MPLEPRNQHLSAHAALLRAVVFGVTLTTFFSLLDPHRILGTLLILVPALVIFTVMGLAGGSTSNHKKWLLNSLLVLLGVVGSAVIGGFASFLFSDQTYAFITGGFVGMGIGLIAPFIITQWRQPTNREGELRAGLSFNDAVALVVGTIIGTGIFIKAAVMAQQGGSITAVILAWLLAAVLSFLGALCYAELGSRLPRSGGEYVFIREGCSPVMAFLYGWTRFWIGSPSAISAYAVGAASFVPSYLQLNLVGGSSVLAVSIVVIFTILNCFEVGFGGKVQVFLTALKIGLILLIAVGVFALSPAGSWDHFTSGPPFNWPTLLTPSFGGAVLAALWAFDGWNNMPMAAAEIKDGQKNVPRALIVGLLIVTVMYVFANFAWFYGVHFDEITTSYSTKFPYAMPVATKAVLPFLGNIGVACISFAFVASAIGAMNGSILTSARVPWAMAKDGVFPKWLASVNPTTHVPVRALIIQGVTATALAASGTFDQLTDYVVFSSWIWYAVAAYGIFKLRRIDGAFQGYKIKLYPLVPILFIMSSLWLMVQAIMSNPRACLIGAGIILSGLPVYYLQQRTK